MESPSFASASLGGQDHAPMRGAKSGYSQLLLLLFAIFGAIGLVLSFVLRLIDFASDEPGDLGSTYPSGGRYWPASAFEPAGTCGAGGARVFFPFCLLSIISLFLSWHPYTLSNVFAEREVHAAVCYTMDWAFFRQFVPSTGLALLLCVDAPAVFLTAADAITCVAHFTGAFMAFVGYAASECKCLRVHGFGGSADAPAAPDALPPNIGLEEAAQRKWLAELIVIYFTAFCVCQVVLHATTDHEVCCHDVFARKWSNFTAEGHAPRTMTLGEFTLVDTASSMLLYLKFCSYIFELIALMALIGSHLVVWYYCKERECSCSGQVQCLSLSAGDLKFEVSYNLPHADAPDTAAPVTVSTDLPSRQFSNPQSGHRTPDDGPGEFHVFFVPKQCHQDEAVQAVPEYRRQFAL